MKILGQLFISFFKTGLLTFGGGYAMLALLKDEIVTRRKWVKEDELLNYFSIGQCTPGIIAVNVATFCGYKLKKTIGAVTATFAMILPSIIIIMLAASVLKEIITHPTTEHILNGVRIGVAALLVKIVYDMGHNIYKQDNCRILQILIFMAAFIALVFLHVSAIFVVLCTLALGILMILSNNLKKGYKK